jgi:hypothetical protein
MNSLVRSDVKLRFRAVALILWIWVFSGSSAMTYGGEFEGIGDPGRGFLGYGKGGLYPGFQGFGLKYHPGYGYGGDAYGVGVFGGYPFYGGPGYPHCAPQLRRFGRIAPFSYYGGPGYSAGYSNYFQGIGQLFIDRPVVMVGDRSELDYASGFGPFTGAVPFPDPISLRFSTPTPTTESPRPTSSSYPSPTTNTAPNTRERHSTTPFSLATGEVIRASTPAAISVSTRSR